MSDYHRLDAALDRAVLYRRSQAPLPERNMPNIRERVTGQHRYQPLALTGRWAGWWDIGSVLDEFADLTPRLTVIWHPETDAVKVEQPRRYVPRPDPPVPVYVDFNDLPADQQKRILGYESDRKR